jgi:hypothetical protein
VNTNAAKSLGLSDRSDFRGAGDRWSLIVIRDLMFSNRHHFRELLTRSEERIASNILADRLTRLAPPRVNDRLWIWHAKSGTAYLRSKPKFKLRRWLRAT